MVRGWDRRRVRILCEESGRVPVVCFRSRDRLVVRTSRCGRDDPGSNPGHGRFPTIFFFLFFLFCLFVLFLVCFVFFFTYSQCNVNHSKVFPVQLQAWSERLALSRSLGFRQYGGRVVKALDLSSNGRMSAWVRTPSVLKPLIFLLVVDSDPRYTLPGSVQVLCAPVAQSVSAPYL